MKTFYTERDIDDLHAAGVAEIEIDDDVVLTDLAREYAIKLGLRLKRVKQRTGPPVKGIPPALAEAPPKLQSEPSIAGAASTSPAAEMPAGTPPASGTPAEDPVAIIKAAVVARLGTDKHNALLDRLIPRIMAQLGK